MQSDLLRRPLIQVVSNDQDSGVRMNKQTSPISTKIIKNARKARLQQLCQEKDIPHEGTCSQLRQRLYAYLDSHADEVWASCAATVSEESEKAEQKPLNLFQKSLLHILDSIEGTSIGKMIDAGYEKLVDFFDETDWAQIIIWVVRAVVIIVVSVIGINVAIQLIEDSPGGPVQGWVPGILAFFVVAIVTGIVHSFVRLLAALAVILLIVAGAVLAYTLANSIGQLVGIAAIAGVVIGVLTIPLVHLLK
jgi:hypothetical protein